MLLSICIPTYNRIQCLDNCLNSIYISKKNVKNLNFEVCISDNCSNEDTSKIIHKYHSKLPIVFKKNKQNIGFAKNAIQTVSMAKGKFAWLIGNDDLILPRTLLILQDLLENNKNIDYFFINSYYLNSSFLKYYNSPFDTTHLDYRSMSSISKAKENKVVKFWDIIDPKVSWEFLIGIFLSLFNREKWLEGLKFVDAKNLEDNRLWSNFDNTCLNAKIISSVFKDSNCYIQADPLSVNLIGEREWINLYDFVEIVRIPELIDYYRSQGMGLIKYIKCKNYALRNFFNFFFKIYIHGDKAGKSYVKIYQHFFKNLIFPNAWLSLIYFAYRKTKLLIK